MDMSLVEEINVNAKNAKMISLHFIENFNRIWHLTPFGTDFTLATYHNEQL